MTPDPVLDDPGELLRFWLWHERYHTVRGFKVANLGKAIKAKPGTVSAWLTRPTAIPNKYWNPIARFFERESYRQLEDEAKQLLADKAERQDYVPLYQLRLKRRRRRHITTTRTRPSPLGSGEDIQDDERIEHPKPRPS